MNPLPDGETAVPPVGGSVAEGCATTPPPPRGDNRAARIRILVDDREQRSGVAEALSRVAGVDVRIRRLRVGDYAIPGVLAIERKTAADFALSLLDGRLFRQAGALVADGRRGVLILEQGMAGWVATGISREAWQGALVTLSLVFGIPVLHSEGTEETAALIRYTAGQFGRRVSGAVARGGYRPKGRRRRQMYILQGLPNVGPARAAALLDRFGSVAAAIGATGEELAAVNGVGAKTAARIADLCR